MRKYKLIIIFINLIAILLFFNLSVIKKEKILLKGKVILLKLAPKDPRSLIQGDYMTLRYSISSFNNKENKEIPSRGYYVVRLNDKNVATKIRVQKNRKPIRSGEYLIKYYKKGYHNIAIGAESYFFQEGNAKKFENARYGALKVDKDGNSLLVNLYDEKLVKIE